MRRDRRFNLLGENLFAAGVDARRVAAEQLDGAVGQVARPVTGYRVADAVDHGEGGGRLGGVALVAQRHVTALREPADTVVARLEHTTEVVGDNAGVRTGVERAGRYRPGH